MKMKLGFLFYIVVQLSTSWSPLPTDAAALTSWSYPSFVTGIQGQSITITFVGNLSDHATGVTWKFVTIRKADSQVISIAAGAQKTVQSGFTSRASDLDLNVTQTGAIVTVKFTFSNLVKATDEGAYSINPFGTSDFQGSVPPSSVSLSINIKTNITSPNLATVTVNETQTAQLVCTATGHPTPSINWTRDGVIVGTGSPFTTPAVTYHDDKTCYTCVAYNGVLDAKMAKVCLNLQYKPRKATISVEKTVVCQNDKVNLTCTSGPANPAASSYEFYNNDVHLGTSASNVYEARATAGSPAVNKFVCVPRNLLGGSLENGSVEIAAKEAPTIVTYPRHTTLAERDTLTLFCNASGLPAPNITWTKVGGNIAGTTNTETYTISSVTRGDQGTYRCTASNGHECSSVTADANVLVNYASSNTSICNPGVPVAIFVAVITVAVVVIVLLTLLVIWQRFKGMQTNSQKNNRINSEEENKNEVHLETTPQNAPSLDTESGYENEGFISRQTERNRNLALYEQVQSSGLIIDQGVGGGPSFPMQNLPQRTGAVTAENQARSSHSQFEEPSYQPLDPREMEGAKRVYGNQGSYGHLMGRPENNTAVSSQDHNPYQELQPENHSRDYQSLQNMERPAYNV